MSRLFLGRESDDLVCDGEMTVTYSHVKTCFTRLHAHMHASTPRACTQARTHSHTQRTDLLQGCSSVLGRMNFNEITGKDSLY